MSSPQERWIEAEWMRQQDGGDTDDDEAGLDGLFQDPDPYDTFEFDWSVEEDRRIAVRLRGHKQELGQQLNSTGLTLWRAARVLSDFLVRHVAEYVENRRVLELGAGLGLCGILASHLGAAEVLLTDGDTDALANLRANVAQNRPTTAADPPRIAAAQLVWGRDVDAFRDRHGGRFDVVLGSDIIYIPEVLEPLFAGTVPALLAPGGCFLLSYARRNVSIDRVLAAARAAGFAWTETDGPEGVYVFRRAA